MKPAAVETNCPQCREEMEKLRRQNDKLKEVLRQIMKKFSLEISPNLLAEY